MLLVWQRELEMSHLKTSLRYKQITEIHLFRGDLCWKVQNTFLNIGELLSFCLIVFYVRVSVSFFQQICSELIMVDILDEGPATFNT